MSDNVIDDFDHEGTDLDPDWMIQRSDSRWYHIDGTVRVPAQPYEHLAVMTTKMPAVPAPWLPNALIEEGLRLGAQAGDTVHGTYKPVDGRMVLDPSTVTISQEPMTEPPPSPPFVSGPSDTVAP